MTTLEPDRETIRLLARFLAARHAETDAALQSLGSAPPAYEVRTALEFVGHGLYRHMGSSGAGHIWNEITRHDGWTTRADRIWWAMVNVARLHELHPDLPDQVRPFLTSEEWR